MKKFIVTLIVLVVSTCILHSQNKIIQGRVIDNNLKILSYVSLVIDDTLELGRTDLNGFFQISVPVSVKKIYFNAVGLEPTFVQLLDTCNILEVVMILSNSYDFITLKKADKLRMKRFMKLSELHKEAFEKGLFKTEKACYTQEFIPLVRKKQKWY